MTLPSFSSLSSASFTLSGLASGSLFRSSLKVNPFASRIPNILSSSSRSAKLFFLLNEEDKSLRSSRVEWIEGSTGGGRARGSQDADWKVRRHPEGSTPRRPRRAHDQRAARAKQGRSCEDRRHLPGRLESGRGRQQKRRKDGRALERSPLLRPRGNRE